MHCFSRYLRVLTFVIAAAVSITFVQPQQPAAAQEQPNIADLLARVAANLPAGTTIGQATLAQFQAAAYAAVRAALIENPSLAAGIASALASVAPDAAAAINEAIQDAVSDAVAANEIAPETASRVAQDVTASIEEAAPGNTATLEKVPTEALIQSGQ